MTYIEFFDKVDVRNVISSLITPPERIIYVGSSTRQMWNRVAKYQKLFEDRGISIEFDCRSVSRSNLEKAYQELEEIVLNYDDCVFDITGGDEILNMALGMLYGKYPDKNIQFHRVNVQNNAVCDCDKDGLTIEKNTPTLSVEENIRIYGGEVVWGDVTSEDTWDWDMTEAFRDDALAIWEICRAGVRQWNNQAGCFEAILATGTIQPGGLTVTAEIAAAERFLWESNRSWRPVDRIIDDLLDGGLLTRYDDSDGIYVTVGFKDLQVRRCLSRAGTALEMKIFITLRELGIYTDCRNGVKIDWDGVTQEEDRENEDYSTENEIDVLAMRHLVPVFVSCKNGFVDANELYKLNTVTRRFGGPIGKMVLVANGISNGKSGEFLRERCRRMDIRLIENVHKMPEALLRQELMTLAGPQ